MSGLARQLRWLILTRLVVVTSIVIPLLLYQLLLGQQGPVAPAEPLPPPPVASTPDLPQGGTAADEPASLSPSPTPSPPPLPYLGVLFVLGLALALYTASGIFYFLLRRFPDSVRQQAHLQFVIDLCTVTLIVWKLGVGISNPFTLFYLLVIAAASILLGRNGGFSVAILAYLFYASLMIGLTYGWIPTANLTEPPGEEPFTLAYNLFVHLFAFVAISILTAALARRLERTEQELEVEREDLARLQLVHRDVIESIQSGLITTDLEGRITSVNRAGIEILRQSEDELLGTSITDTDLFDETAWRGHSTTARDQEDRHRAEVEIERNGVTVHIGFSLSRLHDGSGEQKGLILIFQDFSRWRELEEQVRIKDRMAAVGELAAGIAHEIGNPLAAISGSVQLLAQSLESHPGEQRLLEILLKESQRLDRTIKGFLRFARPRERSTVLFDVAELLAENCELLRNSSELREPHRLEVELDPPSVELYADPDQVSQIFWNLVRNALKAMEDGGVLRVHGHPEGDHYVLEVSDTGHGMDEEERANLFHPFQSFFDTGTGIGMAIVYRIVEEHGGKVLVSSHRGGGTGILVELPGISVESREPESKDRDARMAGGRPV